MIPNLLSLFRAFLGPVVFFTVKSGFTYWSLVIVFIAGISDFLDGYLARRFNDESTFGQALDPICDKIFSFGLFLGFLGKIPTYLALSIIARDILILLGSILIKNKINNKSLKPLFIGKMHTAILMIFAICVLLDVRSLISLGYLVVMFTTIYSTYSYSMIFIKNY